MGMTQNRNTTGFPVAHLSSRVYFMVKKNHRLGTERIPMFSSLSQKCFASREGEIVIMAYANDQMLNPISMYIREFSPGLCGLRVRTIAMASAAMELMIRILIKIAHSISTEGALLF